MAVPSLVENVTELVPLRLPARVTVRTAFDVPSLTENDAAPNCTLVSLSRIVSTVLICVPRNAAPVRPLNAKPTVFVGSAI